MANVPGWFPDPVDPSRLRWWNGIQWTDDVSHGISSAQGPMAPAQVAHKSGCGKAFAIMAGLVVVGIIGLFVVAYVMNKGEDTPQLFCTRMAETGRRGGVVNEEMAKHAPKEIRSQFETVVIVSNMDEEARRQYLAENPEKSYDITDFEAWVNENCPD